MKAEIIGDTEELLAIDDLSDGTLVWTDKYGPAERLYLIAPTNNTLGRTAICLTNGGLTYTSSRNKIFKRLPVGFQVKLTQE